MASTFKTDEGESTTVFTDSVVFDVIKEIAGRAEVGLKKYNKTLDREDVISSEWVQHAYEECLDMALYLKRLKRDIIKLEEELQAARDMVKNTNFKE